MAISFPKANQVYEFLEAGEYGAGGEAEVVACSATADDGSVRTKPWPTVKGGDHHHACCELTVAVQHPTKGVMRVTQFLDIPESADEKLGNRTAKTFRQLGISDEQIENGFDETQLVGKQVIITVTNSVSGDNTYANIANVLLRK
tara:strand:- start:522 stop:956 length:435 start_codon:yes stop_codon:yes gene_type:complete